MVEVLSDDMIQAEIVCSNMRLGMRAENWKDRNVKCFEESGDCVPDDRLDRSSMVPRSEKASIPPRTQF